MTIQLNEEQERLVDQAIRAGLIHDVEEVVEAGIEAIRQRLTSQPAAHTLSHEEWSRALQAWVDSHPTDTPLLSDEAISRESIYADRGL